MDFLNHLLEVTPSSELLLHLVHVYGLHLVVLCLSCMTVYRREMSCNHCYAEKEEENTNDKIVRPSDGEAEWDDMRTEKLLESAGMYCSGASLLPTMLQILEHFQWTRSAVDDSCCAVDNIQSTALLPSDRPEQSMNSASIRPRLQATLNGFTLLNLDTQVHILSFLLPQDVSAFECTAKGCQAVVREEALWKTLWHRDYAWILDEWDVGRRAAQRSGRCMPPRFDKEFYVRFQLCWQNYVLAGENTYESCLVGLGGHVFNLSFFLSSHPGSPETVLVHAGKDATDFFTGLRHSTGARRLAQSLCIVVDTARTDDSRANEVSCGLRPTCHTTMSRIAPAGSGPVAPVIDCLLNPRRAWSLLSVRNQYLQEETAAKEAASRYNHMSLSGETNVYYDPLLNEWKAWYTDSTLQVIFVNEL